MMLVCGAGVLVGVLLPWYEVEGTVQSGFELRGAPAAFTGALGALLVVLASARTRVPWRTAAAGATGAAVVAIAAPWAFRQDGVEVHPQVVSDAFDAVSVGLQLSVLAGAVAFVAASVMLGTWGGHLLTAALILISLVADVAVSISIADERVFCGTMSFVLRVLVCTVPLALAALARIRATEAARRAVARALTAAVVGGPLLALAVVQTLPTGICGD